MKKEHSGGRAALYPLVKSIFSKKIKNSKSMKIVSKIVKLLKQFS